MAHSGDLAKRGINVGSVSLDLPKMMKEKSDSVKALTTGIDMLFKVNYKLEELVIHYSGFYMFQFFEEFF